MIVELTSRQQRILWKGLVLYYHNVPEENEDLANEIGEVACLIGEPLSEIVIAERLRSKVVL